MCEFRFSRARKAGWAVALGAVWLLIGRESSAQTVMLPTFSNFSYSGSVMAPDGGSIRAGGISSHSEGSSSRGVPGLGNIPGLGRGFRNQGIGRETGNSGLTINPQVVIMEELERDHLAAAGFGPDGQRAGGEAAAAILAKAQFLTRHMGRNEIPPDAAPSSRYPGNRYPD